MGKNEEQLFEYIRNVLYAPGTAKLDPASFPPESQRLCEGLKFLGECVAEAATMADLLARGKIDEEFRVDVRNPLAAPLKTIQSNLAHLAWVAECVTRGDYGQHVEYMGVFTDSFNAMVDQLKEQKQLLEESAYADALTGIGNRLCCNRQMKELWDKKIPYTIAFIDIDHLKYCNDHFGHSEGDNYILQVCNYLQLQCEADDILFRLGGDEFLLLSYGTDEAVLEQRLEGIRERFIEYYSGAVAYPCGFSYGCALVDPNGTVSYSHALSNADQRMYSYKVKRKTDRREIELPIRVPMSYEKSGSILDSRVFEALAQTLHRRYIYLCDLQENRVRWSQNAVRDFNLPGEYMENIFDAWKERLHPDDQDAFQRDINAVFSKKKPYHHIECRVLHSSGHYVSCTCTGYLLKGAAGQPDLFAGMVVSHGIADGIDPVTNLYNTYEFLAAVGRLRTSHEEADILALGINQFHNVNDTYGYSFGDQVLLRFVQQLCVLVRDRGTLYRLDGVRFACILCDMEQQEIMDLYQKTQRMATALVVEESSVSLVLSAAALHFENMDITGNTLLAELNYALSVSRENSEAGLVYYNASQQGLAYRRMSVIETVRRSVLNDCQGFYVLYQPQVDSQGKAVGAEALLRWKDNIWGMVLPSEYIQVLENDSCFYDLGLWIMRTALRETLPLLGRYPDFKISINISYRQLERRSFRQDVMEALEETKFPARSLVLELTGRCQTINRDILREDLKFFRSKGVKAVADDFGIGYSSIGIFRDLQFDCVKIDQSFISGITAKRDNQILVKSIVDCAREFGISVCVEGIEDERTLREVQSYGAQTYQGYFFAKPMTIPELRKFIERQGFGGDGFSNTL